MILPNHVHENCLRSATVHYPTGASGQGSREFVFTIVSTVSNLFRKCGLPIRLGIESEFRTLTAMTVFMGRSIHSVPITLMGGVLTLGKERLNVEHAESVALLVRAIIKSIEIIPADELQGTKP